jgi:hypothetical protein
LTEPVLGCSGLEANIVTLAKIVVALDNGLNRDATLAAPTLTVPKEGAQLIVGQTLMVTAEAAAGAELPE